MLRQTFEAGGREDEEGGAPEPKMGPEVPELSQEEGRVVLCRAGQRGA